MTTPCVGMLPKYSRRRRAGIIPGALSQGSRSQIRMRSESGRRTLMPGAERKTNASTHGRASFRKARCFPMRSASLRALALANIRGLSMDSVWPSFSQSQLWRLPATIPPRLLISTKKTPARVITRASISLTEPSSAMNSKFV